MPTVQGQDVTHGDSSAPLLLQIVPFAGVHVHAGLQFLVLDHSELFLFGCIKVGAVVPAKFEVEEADVGMYSCNDEDSVFKLVKCATGMHT